MSKSMASPMGNVFGAAQPPVPRPLSFKTSSKKQRAQPTSDRHDPHDYDDLTPLRTTDHAGPSTSHSHTHKSSKKPRAQSMTFTRQNGVTFLGEEGVPPPVPSPLGFKKQPSVPAAPEPSGLFGDGERAPRRYSATIAAVNSWVAQVEPGSPPPGSTWSGHDAEVECATLVDCDGVSRRVSRSEVDGPFDDRHRQTAESKKPMNKLKGLFKTSNTKKVTRA